MEALDVIKKLYSNECSYFGYNCDNARDLYVRFNLNFRLLSWCKWILVVILRESKVKSRYLFRDTLGNDCGYCFEAGSCEQCFLKKSVKNCRPSTDTKTLLQIENEIKLNDPKLYEYIKSCKESASFKEGVADIFRETSN